MDGDKGDGWRETKTEGGRKGDRDEVCLSVSLSVCLSVCLSLCLSVCLSVCLSFVYLSVSPLRFFAYKLVLSFLPSFPPPFLYHCALFFFLLFSLLSYSLYSPLLSSFLPFPSLSSPLLPRFKNALSLSEAHRARVLATTLASLEPWGKREEGREERG
jgi:hypothetical protein